MADKFGVVPIARVVERKFPAITPDSFPSTADTLKKPTPVQDDAPKENVTPLSWWRRMVGKKAG